MKHLSFALTLFAISSGPLFAQSLETGVAAYEAEEYETAIQILQPIAEQGDMAAQYYVGELYATGHGFTNVDNVEIVEAEQWIRRSSDQGYPYAQIRLGNMYEEGVPLIEGVLIEQNPTEAARLYTLAVEQLIPLANQGDAKAQLTVGYMQSQGQGLPIDQDQTANWYIASAEQGYADAQYMLARLYETGEGVTADMEIAASWHLKAAEQEYFPAMMQLAQMYSTGTGVPQDEEKFRYWFDRAVSTSF